MFEHLLSDIKSVLFPRQESHAIPMLDGPFKPNNLLEAAPEIGDPLPGCDDIAVGDNGEIYVSSGRKIWRLSGTDWLDRQVFVEFDADVGALAFKSGKLYAGIAARGVVLLENGQQTALLADSDGGPLRCPTAIAVLSDGGVAIAEGSSKHLPERWCHDLMERNSLGRVIRASADLTQARTIAAHLAWPSGVVESSDRREIWVSEAWKHRILAVANDGAGRPRVVIPNLPGYPARLSRDAGDGFWLAIFALRTQLVELVLSETDYRKEMIATIDPVLWIAPSLRATGDYLEPLQGGAIKKLGIIKPWAPARSYGLVARLSASGEGVQSLHSRVGGAHHGVTAVHAIGDRLVVAAKGGDCLLGLAIGETA